MQSSKLRRTVESKLSQTIGPNTSCAHRVRECAWNYYEVMFNIYINLDTNGKGRYSGTYPHLTM